MRLASRAERIALSNGTMTGNFFRASLSSWTSANLQSANACSIHCRWQLPFGIGRRQAFALVPEPWVVNEACPIQ